MPVPGVPNNPSGVNSFDHFAPEPAYGEATKQKALAGGAPLAGGQVAAGQLNAANRAQDQAVSPPSPASPQSPQPTVAAAPAEQPPVSLWQEIAAFPGAERHPILAYYAGLT